MLEGMIARVRVYGGCKQSTSEYYSVRGEGEVQQNILPKDHGSAVKYLGAMPARVHEAVLIDDLRTQLLSWKTVTRGGIANKLAGPVVYGLMSAVSIGDDTANKVHTAENDPGGCPGIHSRRVKHYQGNC